jgi:FAD/FMN-containing dehydrogenase
MTRPGRTRTLVRVQSGSTLRQLNRRLDAVGLAFSNLGGYDAQTVVGAGLAAFRSLNASGVFDGEVTDRLGISIRQRA